MPSSLKFLPGTHRSRRTAKEAFPFLGTCKPVLVYKELVGICAVANRQRKTVLVAEDKRDMRELAWELLSATGQSILAASQAPIPPAPVSYDLGPVTSPFRPNFNKSLRSE